MAKDLCWGKTQGEYNQTHSKSDSGEGKKKGLGTKKWGESKRLNKGKN